MTPDERRRLEALLGRARVPLDATKLAINGHPLVPPSMTPDEARVRDLWLIAKKAAANLQRQGVGDAGPLVPRPWWLPECIRVRREQGESVVG